MWFEMIFVLLAIVTNVEMAKAANSFRRYIFLLENILKYNSLSSYGTNIKHKLSFIWNPNSCSDF